MNFHVSSAGAGDGGVDVACYFWSMYTKQWEINSKNIHSDHRIKQHQIKTQINIHANTMNGTGQLATRRKNCSLSLSLFIASTNADKFPAILNIHSVFWFIRYVSVVTCDAKAMHFLLWIYKTIFANSHESTFYAYYKLRTDKTNFDRHIEHWKATLLWFSLTQLMEKNEQKYDYAL